MDRRTEGWKEGGKTEGRTDGWVEGGTEGRTNGKTEERSKVQISMLRCNKPYLSLYTLCTVVIIVEIRTIILRRWYRGGEGGGDPRPPCCPTHPSRLHQTFGPQPGSGDRRTTERPLPLLGPGHSRAGSNGCSSSPLRCRSLGERMVLGR